MEQWSENNNELKLIYNNFINIFKQISHLEALNLFEISILTNSLCDIILLLNDSSVTDSVRNIHMALYGICALDSLSYFVYRLNSEKPHDIISLERTEDTIHSFAFSNYFINVMINNSINYFVQPHNYKTNLDILTRVFIAALYSGIAGYFFQKKYYEIKPKNFYMTDMDVDNATENLLLDHSNDNILLYDAIYGCSVIQESMILSSAINTIIGNKTIGFIDAGKLAISVFGIIPELRYFWDRFITDSIDNDESILFRQNAAKQSLICDSFVSLASNFVDLIIKIFTQNQTSQINFINGGNKLVYSEKLYNVGGVIALFGSVFATKYTIEKIQDDQIFDSSQIEDVYLTLYEEDENTVKLDLHYSNHFHNHHEI